MAALPSSDFEKRIQAALLRVYSRKLPEFLLRAYDECARAFSDDGEPLTEEVLTERIPGIIFREAVKRRGFPYPLSRHRGSRIIRGSFLRPVPRELSREEVPLRELTDTFGGHKVTEGFRARFIGQYLDERIAHWRDLAETRAKVGASPKSGKGETIAKPKEGKSGRSAAAAKETQERRRALIDRYCTRTEPHLTRADLARRAGTCVTAIQGMVKGDHTRYGEERLSRFLQAIGVTPEQWS